eukprot:scaffold79336_cov57-Phaeocystis_antarctica.AAC.1
MSHPDRTHRRTRYCPPTRNSSSTWCLPTRRSHPAELQRGRCLDRKEGAVGLRRCNQHAGEGLAPARGSGQGTGGAELKQGRARL